MSGRFGIDRCLLLEFDDEAKHIAPVVEWDPQNQGWPLIFPYVAGTLFYTRPAVYKSDLELDSEPLGHHN